MESEPKFCVEQYVNDSEAHGVIIRNDNSRKIILYSVVVVEALLFVIIGCR